MPVTSKEFLQSLGGQSSRDEALYGFIPGDWLPDWVKAGYNQSIEGMAQQVVKGKPVFSLDENYDPNMFEDVAATVLSFLTPTDIATMAIGGGVGGLAVKSSMKLATKKLIQAGAEKAVAGRAVNIASKRLMNQARARAVTGTTGLGFYSGLQSSLGQEVTTGSIDFTRTLKDAAIGASLGAATGGLGAAVKYKALAKGLTSTQATALEKSAEAGLFGTMGPLMEGELPSAESYIHAAGVIGGLSLSKAIKNKWITPSKETMSAAAQEKLFRKNAEAKVQREVATERGKEEWVNEEGRRVTILTDWVNQERNETILRVKDVKTGKEDNINKKEFFQPGNFRKAKDKAGTSVEQTVLRNSFSIKGRLNISDIEFKTMVDKAAFGLESTEKFPLKKHKAPNREYHTNWNELTPVQKQRLLKELQVKQRVEHEIKTYKEIGIEIPEASGTSLFKKVLPKTVYNILHGSKEGLKTLGGRVTNPKHVPLFEAVKNDYYTMDSRQATLFQNLSYRLRNATYVTRGGTRIKGLHRTNKKLRRELAEDLEDGSKGAKERTKEYREVLNVAIETAKKSGIDVAPYEENYFPRKIKKKVLKAIRDDINKFGNYDSRELSWELHKKEGFELRLETALKSGELSKDTVDAIYGLRQKLSESQKRSVSLSEAFEQVRNEIFSEIVVVNKNLEMARKGIELDKDIFYERDAGVVLTDYMAQLAKRVAFVETAGKDGSKVYNKIKALNDIGGHNEAELLYKSINTFTGTIELDRKYNWSPKTKGILNDIVNFQVATKIGLGFATIPNITQPFISSVLKAGYGPFFRGTWKIVADKNYREAVKKYSGSGSLELHSMIAGFNPSETSWSSWAADKITRASLFQGINRVNKFVSAYTGYEAALKWQKIAQKSKIKRRRDWAKANLKAMRITDVNKKITQKNMARAMYEFSRDTQLQKNVFREPAFFNDPRMQPFVLFKRFGYRQAEWISKELKKEVIDNKNAAFALRLGIAGMAGGVFVQWARQGLTDFLAGKDIYDENYKIAVDGKDYGLNDFIDGMASVGGFGVGMDIIAAESTWRAIDFAVKPAMIQDANKAYVTLQRLMADMETFGPDWVVGRRAIRNIAPVFGSAARRVLEQAETKGQREAYVKFRLSKIRPKILDYMIAGNHRMSKRLIREWNNSFPERPLMIDDIDARAINDRLMRKYEKSMNP